MSKSGSSRGRLQLHPDPKGRVSRLSRERVRLLQLEFPPFSAFLTLPTACGNSLSWRNFLGFWKFHFESRFTRFPFFRPSFAPSLSSTTTLPPFLSPYSPTSKLPFLLSPSTCLSVSFTSTIGGRYSSVVSSYSEVSFRFILPSLIHRRALVFHSSRELTPLPPSPSSSTSSPSSSFSYPLRLRWNLLHG